MTFVNIFRTFHIDTTRNSLTKGWVKFRTPVRITSIVRLGVGVVGGSSRGRYNFEKSKNTKMKNENEKNLEEKKMKSYTKVDL